MSEPKTQAVVTAPHYAGVGMTAFGGGGSLPALQSLADVVSIAQLMAKAGIAVRKHLRENPGACLGVTMQALRWEMDPFAVANKTYAVSDQLAYEAQLVAAVVISRAPIAKRPKYTYEGEGTDRQCTVTVEMADGDVLDYTTPKVGKIPIKNSPLWKADEDQQLGYYAIRSWARRHTPDVILGVYTPEEIEHAEPMRDVTPATSGVMERLQTSETGKAGFAADNVARETTSGAEDIHDAEVETIDEVLDGDDIPKESEPRPTETASAPTAEAGPASSDSATDAPTDLQDQADSETTAPEADVISEGYPEADEMYFLNGDEWTRNPTGEEDLRDAYKNGVPVGVSGRGAHLIYEDHAPERAKDPEPAPTDAAPALPPELQAYVDALEAATSWKAIREAMGAFYKTATFEAMNDDGKNKIRRQTWPYVVDLQDVKPPEVIDHASDVSAFRLWIEYTSDPDAIEGTLPILAKGDEFGKLPDASQNGIRLAAKKRVDALREG